MKSLLNANNVIKSLTSAPELIFGIVGPIGINIEPVISALENALRTVGYLNCVKIHLTDHVDHPSISTQLELTSYFAKYSSLIARGNEYRKIAGSNDAFAGLAIALIQGERNRLTGDRKDPSPGTAYIVRQFKRPDEIALMRRVYGSKFVQVSIHGSEHDRFDLMVKKIMSFNSSPRNESDCKQEAIRLMQMDALQNEYSEGQQVDKVFHLGDVFVDGINSDKNEKTIGRFVNALFGSTKSSPTKDEQGLYLAFAAALRSVDLSRQVGVAICSTDGEVISLGCNEVPKWGGGAYWEDDGQSPVRDVERQMDPNHERRRQIVHDFIERLDRKGWISSDLKSIFLRNDIDEILRDEQIKNSQVMDIIEFGRIIHAEMTAITECSRLGKSTKNAILYSTTFPCHICAKHIVAAGLKRVVFLEPYPKSWAHQLHSDSITFNHNETNKVLFEPFMGISPRRYREIFDKVKRKDDDGKVKHWYHGTPQPMIEDRSFAYIANEELEIPRSMRGLFIDRAETL